MHSYSARILSLLLLASFGAKAERIAVVVSPRASEPEKLAAEELAEHLKRVYPDHEFAPAARQPASGKSILLRVGKNLPSPEAFRIYTERSGSVAVLEGGSGRAVLFAAYALLEELGWGFYLSEDAAPPARKGAVRPEEWKLEDAPAFADRVVFDWHNFLSSCSTWELEDWQRWIGQSAKMRFNAIMVHSYGNNPMFQFRYNGQTKPVGWLATTAKGRDWGTQHVNDVRRILGGELFQGPVFGGSVAMAPDEQRAAATTSLMRKAFSYARARGMGVTFALDVDTESANPQNILRTLPASARLTDGKFELANPETPEGYDYYKSQVAQLLETYPQIDRLVVWFRNNQTPWRNLTPERFPDNWKREYEAALEKNPKMHGDKEAHGMFVIAKLIVAFQKVLRDLKRTDVELASGTWRFYYLPAADYFFPRDVRLMSLDWEIIFDREDVKSMCRQIGAHRKLTPVVWAHHDDRTYIGRPYTPFPKFASLLKETSSAGYGIIHWTTRPLDLYFKSLGEQVWQATLDRPLRATCEDMAGKLFGGAAAEAGVAYFLKWVTEGRMFGRETSDRFIDVPLKDAPEVIARCRERLRMLESISEFGMTAESRQRLAYFRDYERFTLEFFTAHALLERSQELAKNGDKAGARAAIQQAKPEEVIRLYAQAARRGHISRGEQALAVSLNLRWLPYFAAQRQELGLEPRRIKFQPTQHEPLAQGAGRNTFYFDENRVLWQALGEKETGAREFSNPSFPKEFCRTGIVLDKPLSLRSSPGRYKVELLYRDGGHISTSTSSAWVQSKELTLPLPGAFPVEACGVIIHPVEEERAMQRPGARP